MLSSLFEILSGRDDIERVAARDDIEQLNAYLKTRRILIPRRPRRFLDASGFTPDELLVLLRQEAEELANDPFEPWVLDLDGARRLPAFSSQKRMVTFSGVISRRIDRVFALGSAEVLLADAVASVAVDFVDLNLFCRRSWEIGIGKLRKS